MMIRSHSEGAMNAELHEFAQTIAEALKSAPINKELWRIDDIAEYLQCSRTQVTSRYMCRQDFPKAIKLPYDDAKGVRYSHPLWRADDVRAWTLKHQQKGRPRSA